MSVFISYSHEDRDFVDQLASNLMIRKTRVWVDRWELKVGDSLIQRIQDALEDASALLVILSKASVESEWCKKELSVGLIRELDERRVVVLPVLLEDCKVPLLLRDKLYADFRSDFDKGLNDVLEGIAAVTNDRQGRIEKHDYHSDWAMDWGTEGANIWLELTIVEQSDNVPFVVLTTIRILANQFASERYEGFKRIGSEWFGQNTIVEYLAESVQSDNFQLLLPDEMPVVRTFGFGDPKRGDSYSATVTSRRLGEDTGKTIFVDYGAQIVLISEAVKAVTVPPGPEEQQRILDFLTNG